MTQSQYNPLERFNPDRYVGGANLGEFVLIGGLHEKYSDQWNTLAQSLAEKAEYTSQEFRNRQFSLKNSTDYRPDSQHLDEVTQFVRGHVLARDTDFLESLTAGEIDNLHQRYGGAILIALRLHTGISFKGDDNSDFPTITKSTTYQQIANHLADLKSRGLLLTNRHKLAVLEALTRTCSGGVGSLLFYIGYSIDDIDSERRPTPTLRRFMYFNDVNIEIPPSKRWEFILQASSYNSYFRKILQEELERRGFTQSEINNHKLGKIIMGQFTENDLPTVENFPNTMEAVQ